MHGVLADVMTASETVERRSITTFLNDATFVDADQARCTKGKQRTCTACWQRYTALEAATIVRSVTGLHSEEAWSKTARQLQQKNVGVNVPCATRMHVSESSEGKVEEHDDGAGRRREDSRSVENVCYAGNVPKEV